MDRDKKLLRKLKRQIKKAGGKQRRQHLKRELRDHPEEAPHSEYEFRGNSSETLNGMDQDATRRGRREEREECEEREES